MLGGSGLLGFHPLQLVGVYILPRGLFGLQCIQRTHYSLCRLNTRVTLECFMHSQRSPEHQVRCKRFGWTCGGHIMIMNSIYNNVFEISRRRTRSSSHVTAAANAAGCTTSLQGKTSGGNQQMGRVLKGLPSPRSKTVKPQRVGVVRVSKRNRQLCVLR